MRLASTVRLCELRVARSCGLKAIGTQSAVSVARNCTNRHAAFCFWLVLAMPTMVPVM